MSHTMDIFERIMYRRFGEETTIRDEQFGSMPGIATTGAVTQLLKKQRGETERTAYSHRCVTYNSGELKVR